MDKLSTVFKRTWHKIDKFFTLDSERPFRVLYTFQEPKEIKKWNLFCDAQFGGKSSVQLTFKDEDQAAVFSGVVSKEVDDDSPLVRSGYAGFNHLRRSNLNLFGYEFFEYRVKTDGRTYIASIRCDQMTGGDEETWQARIKTKEAGVWEDVRVPISDFIFSFRGRLVLGQAAFQDMPTHEIMAFGVTFAAQDEMDTETPFELAIQSISTGVYPVSEKIRIRKQLDGWNDRVLPIAEDPNFAKQVEFERHPPKLDPDAPVMGGLGGVRMLRPGRGKWAENNADADASGGTEAEGDEAAQSSHAAARQDSTATASSVQGGGAGVDAVWAAELASRSASVGRSRSSSRDSSDAEISPSTASVSSSSSGGSEEKDSVVIDSADDSASSSSNYSRGGTSSMSQVVEAVLPRSSEKAAGSGGTSAGLVLGSDRATGSDVDRGGR